MLPQYKRIVLKFSGEALAGDEGFGIDPHHADLMADKIAAIHSLEVEVGVVVGRGEFVAWTRWPGPRDGTGYGGSHGHVGHGHECAGFGRCSGASRDYDARADRH